MKKVWVCAVGVMVGLTVAGAAPGLAQSTPATAPATPPAQQQKPAPPPATSDDDSGPVTGTDGIVLPKKNTEEAPPPAPAEEKVKNPDGETFSMRVDVPIVNLDVNVLLDKTHQFVPGLKPDNFLVVEDGVEQKVTSLRVTKTPITAVMLLEFASNSYWFINDMQNAAAAFFRTLQPDDYVAVATYDMRTHILCDFTNNKDVIAESLQSLMIPGFSETNEFDALYEMLDRLSRVQGRKYIILISSGRDTMSRITLDQMLKKIKETPNVTIFTISTGGMLREMSDGGMGMGGASRRMDYLQADNEMRTFAQMTGGMWFEPIFQGALGDVFSQINESIRNQYVLTYRPTNQKNDGSYRKVKVYLVDNEGRPLKMQDEKGKPLKYSVIARDGYRAQLPVQ
ncbi:MAG TPA: VWA domain-containing protein [Candidatus Aquilonibacter sp.]|nr:VWA domain-containing protein [Candidatus Aquilonibacter sp.]